MLGVAEPVRLPSEFSIPSSGSKACRNASLALEHIFGETSEFGGARIVSLEMTRSFNLVVKLSGEPSVLQRHAFEGARLHLN
jgi:hypothetical protein